MGIFLPLLVVSLGFDYSSGIGFVVYSLLFLVVDRRKNKTGAILRYLTGLGIMEGVLAGFFIIVLLVWLVLAHEIR
jgi:hypothetical protein